MILMTFETNGLTFQVRQAVTSCDCVAWTLLPGDAFRRGHWTVCCCAVQCYRHSHGLQVHRYG